MAKLKDVKKKPSYGFKGAVKEGLLGIDPATTGFKQILSESLNTATLFGSESFMGKAFASDEQRERRKGVETGNPIGFTSKQLEDQTAKQEETTRAVEKNTDAVKANAKPAPEVRAKTVDEIKRNARSGKDGITSQQGEEIISSLGAIQATLLLTGGRGGAGLLTGAGLGVGAGAGLMGFGKKIIGGVKGGAIRAIAGGANLLGFKGTADKLKFGSKLPKGTEINADGRLIDSKTKRFVAETDEMKDKKAKANKQSVNKAAKKKAQTRVQQKVGTKIAAKSASKLAFAGTGVGLLVTGALTAFDLGEVALSKGARKEYTLINPMATDEEKEEATQWLIENDPERVGIPKQVPVEDRVKYLALQEEMPDATEAEMLETLGVKTDTQIKQAKRDRKQFKKQEIARLKEEGFDGYIGLNGEGDDKLEARMADYDAGKISLSSPEFAEPIAPMISTDETMSGSNILEQQTDQNSDSKTINISTAPPVVNNQAPVVNVAPTNVTVTLPRTVGPRSYSGQAYLTRLVSSSNP